jgi:hypothetical protein
MDTPPDKKKKTQLPLVRNVRLTHELEAAVVEYLGKNNLSFNMLVKLAVEEFISAPRTWKLEPVERPSLRTKATVYSLKNHNRSRPEDNPSI